VKKREREREREKDRVRDKWRERCHAYNGERDIILTLFLSLSFSEKGARAMHKERESEPERA